MSVPPAAVAAALVLAGLALCLRGYALFRVFLPVTGFLVFGTLAAELARPYAPGDVWTVLGAAFIGGVVGAALLMAAFIYGLFLFGAAFGWYFGLAIAPFLGSAPAHVAMVTAVIGGVAAVLAQKPLIALATSVWGALIAMAGVHVYTGKLVVERLAEPGAIISLVQRADAPLLAVIVLAVVGVVVQLRTERTVLVP